MPVPVMEGLAGPSPSALSEGAQASRAATVQLAWAAFQPETAAIESQGGRGRCLDDTLKPYTAKDIL